MLTTRQLNLVRALGEDPADERVIRQRHKSCVQNFGAVKDFTRWLEKRLHRKWELDRCRNATPYLGD